MARFPLQDYSSATLMAATVPGGSRRAWWPVLALWIAVLCLLAPGRAQTPSPDSLRVAVPDSLAADSTQQRRDDGVDTTVTYSADHIDFDVRTRVSVLEGNARIVYKEMTLDAARITVDWNGQLLTATSLTDTLWVDSLHLQVDTVRVVGKPHFTQANEDFTGEEIAYNLKTKQGRVRGGRTSYEQGLYYGEQFKRISSDVLTVKHGEFTTCDADTPHYHFAANRLKIMVGRRVIAQPVFIYFDDVPVLAAPYGIFPQQHGRTSGIIIPTFGESASQGRFLKDVGYYWAPSQYMDILGTIDYYERFGVLGAGEYRYAKRYALNGNTRVTFNTQRLPEGHRRDYAVSSAHAQTIDENTRLNVNGQYVSSPAYNRQVGSTQSQLNQSVRSNATLSKTWYQSPWTTNTNVGYEQNINQKTWSATLPAFSISHRSGLLFPPPKAARNIRNAVALKEVNPPWSRAFSWSYSASYQNSLSLPRTRRQEGLRLAFPDSVTGRVPSPTPLYGTDTLTVFQRDGASHNAGLSANARILRYLNLNPRVNLRHVWTRKVLNYVPQDSILDRADQTGFFTRTTFDFGTSATTKLYGLSDRPFGLPASFRHVMTPTVGFTYTPDFSDKQWGYFRAVSLPDGRSYRYDRFSSPDGSIVGGTPGHRSELFSFGLDHLFQMKSGDKETGTEKRYDLLAMSTQTGLDLRRDSLKWDDLRTSLRTALPGRLFGPIQGLSFDLSATHSLYARAGNTKIREFFWARDEASWYSPLELLNASANVSFTMQGNNVGEMFYLTPPPRVQTPTDTAATDSLGLPFNPASVPDYRGSVPPPPGTKTERSHNSPLLDMPLNMTFSFRRTKDYRSGNSTSAMGTNAAFSLTPRWSMNVDYNFDLDRKEVRNASVSVTRDLHCWDASLMWSPLGYRPGYYLRIGLKSAQLRDVKIERHRGAGLGGLY
jgi:lipopolysaccharide export system protein LptA